MALRPLAINGGAVATALLLPVVIFFALTDHPEVVRGLLLGLVTGLLNNLLLARKLDRVLRGQDAWQSLRLTMPRNMLLRFGLILLIAWAASRVHGINLPAMAGGLGLCLLVGIVYSCWALQQQWRKEDGAPVYG